MTNAYVFGAVRTPRGRGRAGKGALSQLHPQELLAQTLQQLLAVTGADAQQIDDVIIGCVSQAGEQGGNIAKNAVMHAGLPQHVAGVTLNRFCGSGQQAVNFAAMGVLAGVQDLVIGGGVESMSRQPIGSDGAGIDGNHENLRKKIFQVPQGISADLVAAREGIRREELDAFAADSQRKAGAAMAENRFGRSLFAVRDPATGAVLLDRDENPRPETTAESLAKLPAAFEAMGAHVPGPDGASLDQIALRNYPDTPAIAHVHTAGNSSGIVDGAAAVLVGSQAFAQRSGLRPRARIRAMAVLAAEPVLMLTAPAPASQKALKQAGMSVGDIDLWEINEAFAVVPLETIRRLNIDPSRVNVNGGAIALGHPLGATGAMLLGTALDELERRGLATALVTMCIGGGQGIATILERV
ncbi:MAG: acetyl-CoA C-acetyltransferase [Deltaproteobacteria bacterium]|nr:acetyl-CoA C-acetyltransferase [Deltaproteobacteria bacterium]